MATALAEAKLKSAQPTTCRGVSYWTIHGELVIPSWVKDLASFRQWSYQEPLLEKVKVCYLGDVIWVDTDMEEIYFHNRIKTRIIRRLEELSENSDTGLLFSDGARIILTDVDIAFEPDVAYVTYEAMRSGRVKNISSKKKRGGVVELEGPPELVVEIVSDSSVKKDTKFFLHSLFSAGVAEYWIIDARTSDGRMDIYHRGKAGFEAGRKSNGWIKSSIWNRHFRLTHAVDPLGNPKFDLEVK